MSTFPYLTVRCPLGMPQNEQKLTIFLASPNDVLDERNALRKVVEEVNSTLSHISTGVRFEVQGWEDASPDFGEDAQDVINRQFDPADCDVFIAILWLTIGTHTQRAPSGTVEEYDRAKAYRDENPDGIRLMVYFKAEAPPNGLLGIDSKQFQAVSEFRKRISDEGGLYKTFTSTEDFANEVKMTMTKFAVEWREGDSEDAASSQEVSSEFCGSDDSAGIDDDGMFELEDLLEEELAAATEAIGRMTSAMTEFNGKIQNRRSLLDRAVAESKQAKNDETNRRQSRTSLKRIVKDYAADMTRFADRVRVELPSYRRHFNRALDTFAKLIPIYFELNDDNLEELGNTVSDILESQVGMLNGTESVGEIIAATPRLSTSIGRSKKELTVVLQEIGDITRGVIAALEQAQSMLNTTDEVL